MNIVTGSVDDLPQNLAVVKTYDRLKAAFPKEGVTVDVAVQADNVRSPRVAAAIAQLNRQAHAEQGRAAGTDVTVSTDGTVALISIPTKGNGNDATSTGVLNDVRDQIIPATVGKVDGVKADVSGAAANSKDFRDLLQHRLPLIFAFVFTLAFLLLLFTFRSIVIPIKAILLNLLSVGAAYGVLVLVFQDGRLRGPAGLQLQRRRDLVAAALPVRDPVRAVDGLPRVHPVPHPRGVAEGDEHLGGGARTGSRRRPGQ